MDTILNKVELRPLTKFPVHFRGTLQVLLEAWGEDSQCRIAYHIRMSSDNAKRNTTKSMLYEYVL